MLKVIFCFCLALHYLVPSRQNAFRIRHFSRNSLHIDLVGLQNVQALITCTEHSRINVGEKTKRIVVEAGRVALNLPLVGRGQLWAAVHILLPMSLVHWLGSVRWVSGKGQLWADVSVHWLRSERWVSGKGQLWAAVHGLLPMSQFTDFVQCVGSVERTRCEPLYTVCYPCLSSLTSFRALGHTRKMDGARCESDITFSGKILLSYYLPLYILTFITFGHIYLHNLCTYLPSYLYTYLPTNIHAHIYIHIYIQSYIHTYIHIHIQHTFTYTHIHIWIYSCIHTYIYTWMHTHTYIHTHTYCITYYALKNIHTLNIHTLFNKLCAYIIFTIY